jgi:hypothetical protein
MRQRRLCRTRILHVLLQRVPLAQHTTSPLFVATSRRLLATYMEFVQHLLMIHGCREYPKKYGLLMYSSASRGWANRAGECGTRQQAYLCVTAMCVMQASAATDAGLIESAAVSRCT